MLNAFARILLTATALAPVGFTYAWVAYFQGSPSLAYKVAGISFLAAIFCFVLLWRAKDYLSASTFRAEEIEAADHENTAFLLLYIMPLLTAKLNSFDWEFWVPTVAIFGVITATGYNYHFNPMLGLAGWHFYKVRSKEGVRYVLITRKHLKTASTEIKVGQLTEYILLDIGEA